jgi:TonB family protein
LSPREALASLFFAAILLAQSSGTRPPRVISRSEPEYSEEARRAGVNSTILLSLVVDEDGAPRDIKVDRGAGFGLDEMAIRAIEGWRFDPGTKEGQPFDASTHVEVSFRIYDPARAGQNARLNFTLPPGVQRPELTKGKIPLNPDQSGKAAMRLRFTVGADGKPRDFQALETNNQEWANRAMHDMAGWRFHPAMREGQPQEATAIFELTAKK